MSIRKRVWINGRGVEQEAWICDYSDSRGTRRQKTFSRKKDADAFAATTSIELLQGTHVAASASSTVAEAGLLWLASRKSAVERATLLAYRQHLDLHISPLIGATRLSALTIPGVRAFEDTLREQGRSSAMIKKVLVSLSSLVSDAQERGLVARNVVHDMRSSRKGRGRQEKRQKGRLKVGVDIPARSEVKAIVEALEGRWRPLLLTAIFTGLRASELRGLRWSDVGFDKRTIRVHQRADRYNEIGRPKSESGERAIPVPPLVINTLREWKLACPKGELDLVFPDSRGDVQPLNTIVRSGWIPAQLKAGVVRESGAAKYTGFHALRHFFASWCINSVADGGLGLSAKAVQERLGHSSIVLTLDVYSHLFPRGDDADGLAAAERSLLA